MTVSVKDRVEMSREALSKECKDSNEGNPSEKGEDHVAGVKRQ